MGLHGPREISPGPQAWKCPQLKPGSPSSLLRALACCEYQARHVLQSLGTYYPGSHSILLPPQGLRSIGGPIWNHLNMVRKF